MFKAISVANASHQNFNEIMRNYNIVTDNILITFVHSAKVQLYIELEKKNKK